MNKPEKIFLHNTSLIAALTEGKPNTGNVREPFFSVASSEFGISINLSKGRRFSGKWEVSYERGWEK